MTGLILPGMIEEPACRAGTCRSSNPHAAELAQNAAAEHSTVREAAKAHTGLPHAEIDRLLDTVALSRGLGQTCREHGDSIR